MDRQFNLILEGFSTFKRNTIIFNIEKAINESGAWIVDFVDLSEKQLNFTIECDHSKLKLLKDHLLKAGIQLIDFSIQQFDRIISLDSKKKEINISLIITFVSGEKGDLGTTID